MTRTLYSIHCFPFSVFHIVLTFVSRNFSEALVLLRRATATPKNKASYYDKVGEHTECTLVLNFIFVVQNSFDPPNHPNLKKKGYLTCAP